MGPRNRVLDRSDDHSLKLFYPDPRVRVRAYCFPITELLLARLMGQYCFARCRLSPSSVVVYNARLWSAAAGPGAEAGPAADTARRDSTVTSR